MRGARKKWIIKAMAFDVSDKDDRKEYRRFKKQWTRMSVPEREAMIATIKEYDRAVS